MDDGYNEIEGKLFFGEEKVCDFIPRIEKIIQVVDGMTGNITNSYFVSVILENGQKVQEQVFSSIANIPFASRWRECVGAEFLNSKQQKLVNQFLLLQIREAPKIEKRCWGNWELADSMAIKECEDFSLAEKKNYLRRLFSLKDVAGVLFLCKVAAILKPLFYESGYSMDCFVVLFGRSGVGKSLLAELLFVETNEQELNFKVNSQKEILKTLKSYTGNTVLIDDYHPEALDYGRRKQDSIVDLIARQAKNKDSALAVITAEMREGCFSVQDRMLQVEISGQRMNWKSYQELQEEKGVYLEILKTIVKKAYMDTERVKREIVAHMKYMATGRGEFRISFYVQLLLTSLHILEFLCKDQEMDFWEEEWSEKIKFTLNDLYKNQARYMEVVQTKTNESGIDWVILLYRLIYDKKIFARYPVNNQFDSGKHGGLAIGMYDNKLLIERQTLIKGLELYFEKRTSPKKMVDALIAEGILLEDKTPTHTKKVNGKSYYIIDENALKLFYQFWNGGDISSNEKGREI